VSRTTVSFVLLLWMSIPAPVSAAEMHVLPPHAVGAVRKLLDLATPLEGEDGTSLVLSASIERDRVALRAWDAAKTVRVAVTLLHPSDAAADAQRVGTVAMVLTPGPVPRGLVAQITRRLEASIMTLPWVVVGGEAPAVSSSAAAPPLDLYKIDRHIVDGHTVLARQALALLSIPEDVMEVAALALRWRRAGEPTRAVAMTSGLEAERELYQVVALRLARGEPVTIDAILESLPDEGICRASALAVLLRTDRAYEAAAQLAEAVRTRDATCIEAYHEHVVAMEMDGWRQEAEALLSEAMRRFPTAVEVLAADSFLRMRRGDYAGAWRLKVRLETREIASRALPTLARELFAWLGSEWRRTLMWVASVLRGGGSPSGSQPQQRANWCPVQGKLPCLDLVTGGTFRMGAQVAASEAPGFDVDASPDEAPVHTVTVASFYAMAAEVDVRAYTLCVRADACRVEDVLGVGGHFNYGQPMRADHPMNGVSWFGAQRHCEWMGGRLPTEAEWEFLARGDTGRRFPWGDERPDCDVSGSRRAPEGCPHDGTQAPGLWVAPSATGLTGMGGGVWEWVSDWYAPYAPGPQQGPEGPREGEARVQRGGGWATDDPIERRASYRASMPPESRMSDVGFRCVRSRR
jgi:formylglycine-generating enzyme required for sulfatase activity